MEFLVYFESILETNRMVMMLDDDDDDDVHGGMLDGDELSPHMFFCRFEW